MRFPILTLLVLLWATTAAAQTPPPTPEAQASADAEFAEGQTAFEQKVYGTAASHFAAAYERVNNPLYLFNAAQAYRLANDCYDAWEKYEAFRIQVQDRPVNGLDKVQQYLNSLRECHDKGPSQDNPVSQPPQQPQPQPNAVVTQPQPQPQPQPAASPSRTRPKALAITGGVLVGIAVVSDVLIIPVQNAAQTALDQCQHASSCPTLDSRNNLGRFLTYSAISEYAIGGVLVATATWMWLHRNDNREHVTVAPTPRGGEVLASWHF